MTIDMNGRVPRDKVIDALVKFPTIGKTTLSTVSARAVRAPIVCLSHLRWDFVFQRPQHLMTRLARERQVLYVEEPVSCDGPPRLSTRVVTEGVTVAVAHLPASICAPGNPEGDRVQQQLLEPVIDAMETFADRAALAWYYTPMSTGLIDESGRFVVYDCMDELSGFRFAPSSLIARERELLRRADIVFTGGHSLYQAKRRMNANVHEFPSSVDRAHFATAHSVRASGKAQSVTPTGPRVGWCGVIDERLDLQLVAHLAGERPDWQFIMLGPVVKIDPATLPRSANLHWIGSRPYAELPSYLAGWDAAMMPFALNEATRFISPTKTPEFLAAGLAVASTSVPDVVDSWGDGPLVHIGDGAAFVTALECALDDGAGSSSLASAADAMLDGMSWDRTVNEMDELIESRLITHLELNADDLHAPMMEPTWTI